MCGRARCTLNPNQVARACGLPTTAAGGGTGGTGDGSSIPTHQFDRYRPSYNVSPGAYLPVVMRQKERTPDGSGVAEDTPAIFCMKWGLIPSFTKKSEKPDHYRMFNARSESIKEKASFRRLIPSNRCLLAVEGFYEWKKEGSKKQPYYIHFKDQRPLVFAALYDCWKNAEGEMMYTFTIVTTRSSKALDWLHDRMPVILGNNDSVNTWFNSTVATVETVLGPYEDADLVWYPVTPSVGKPSFDGPECIKEIQLKCTTENPISKFFSKKADVKEEREKPKQSSEDTSQKAAYNSLKEEHDADNAEYGHFSAVKKENSETDKTRIKTEYEEMEKYSGTMTGLKREYEEMESYAGMGSQAKKERNAKSTGEKQASLLSYFGHK